MPDARGTVAFDMVGTFFALQGPRSTLEEIGAPSHALDLWLAQALRDSFGWSHAGGYRPLTDVLRATLPRTLRMLEVEHRDEDLDEVLGAFRSLEPAEGAEKACTVLSDAGWRVLALTNGAEDATRKLLRRSGLEDRFHSVLSSDAIEVTKPDPRVYEMAIEHAEGPIWMVAAHAWDVAGASRAGLHTAWIESIELVYPDVFPAPDIRAGDVHDAATQILHATEEG